MKSLPKTHRTPRRIVSVLLDDGNAVRVTFLEGAYETDHFVILPCGKRLSTSDEGTEHWFGKKDRFGMRLDHFGYAQWRRSACRAKMERQAAYRRAEGIGARFDD